MLGERIRCGPLHQGLNSQRCISFSSIVHQYIDGAALAGGLLDQCDGVPPQLRYFVDDACIGSALGQDRGWILKRELHRREAYEKGTEES